MELRWRLRQPPAVEGVSRGSDPVNGFELEDKRSRTGAKLLRGFALTDSFPRFRPPRLARREDWCGLMLRQAGLSRGSDSVNGFELEDKRSRTGAKPCPGPRITENTLLACPQSDHDLRRHSTGGLGSGDTKDGNRDAASIVAAPSFWSHSPLCPEQRE